MAETLSEALAAVFSGRGRTSSKQTGKAFTGVSSQNVSKRAVELYKQAEEKLRELGTLLKNMAK